MSPRRLFDPVSVGPLSLRNRIVMAPMTRAFSPGGVPNRMNIEYYVQRAGAGSQCHRYIQTVRQS